MRRVGVSEEAEARRESRLHWELPTYSFTESSRGQPHFRDEETKAQRDEASDVVRITLLVGGKARV